MPANGFSQVWLGRKKDTYSPENLFKDSWWRMRWFCFTFHHWNYFYTSFEPKPFSPQKSSCNFNKVPKCTSFWTAPSHSDWWVMAAFSVAQNEVNWNHLDQIEDQSNVFISDVLKTHNIQYFQSKLWHRQWNSVFTKVL